MNYWLVKTEPDAYSWQRFVREGRAMWDGVRNFTARNNLKKMKAGDNVLFYHSNIGKEVVGVARVVKESYPDPTAKEPGWVVVDLEPLGELERPVSLEQIKSEPALKNILILRQGRLSVVPLAAAEFKAILKMGGNS
ncbi:MAG: ubiquinol-cytochrome C reductase [Elusimicrobia bacterium RIFCSPLOWO2_01_FULL_54_10]|nr:MAG: ubiquinol-cytochrome C reductase [Elusimicrobia bacterium RIFCSPLOWO2_01_FULL_54_10]